MSAQSGQSILDVHGDGAVDGVARMGEPVVEDDCKSKIWTMVDERGCL